MPVTRLIESVYLLTGHLQLAKKLRPHRGRRLVNRHAAAGPAANYGTCPRTGIGRRLFGFLITVRASSDIGGGTGSPEILRTALMRGGHT